MYKLFIRNKNQVLYGPECIINIKNLFITLNVLLYPSYHIQITSEPVLAAKYFKGTMVLCQI